MKKIFIVGAGLIVVGLMVLVFKGRKVTTPESVAEPRVNVQLIETYLAENPSDPATPQLQRLSAALKAHPENEPVLAQVAAFSLQDGRVTPQEAEMLQEAAVLAEKSPLSEPDLKTFSTKYPAATTAIPALTATASSVSMLTPESAVASNAVAAQAIDTYLKKNPSSHGATSLKRLSSAIKARPASSPALVEAVARSVQDGTISQAEVAMLSEAAELVEKEGLSPSEMAEFSRKYAQGVGLAQKPVSAELPAKTESVPLPSFEGKRQLTYTFTGVAQCAGAPCTNVRVSVRVTSGKWVETRSEVADAQGNYSLQLPILSLVNEKVLWQLEAYSKDLRKAELRGERLTSSEDKDISLQNNLVLNPA